MTGIDSISRLAATAIIVRDSAGAPPDILMVERASSMAFAAGALVFPGGTVDQADLELARRINWSGDVEEAGARLAAIRETLEESGLGIGFVRSPTQAELTGMRAALNDGVSLASLLQAYGLELALEQLVPFSRWHPAVENIPRVFDTRFYVVRAPGGQGASADLTENVRLFWRSAQDTLSCCDAGNGHVIFPTRRNLERLALFGSFEEIAAHAAAVPVEKIRPWFEDREGQRHLCIPDHLGYPVTSEPWIE
ncbi:NUDIX hydrolase [Sphingobium mellinum]|uniref:NUDIX hydrolase n=1 Tax=Sphingobium mellinum TaxID=1387166 RepID=UPI0030ED6AB0